MARHNKALLFTVLLAALVAAGYLAWRGTAPATPPAELSPGASAGPAPGGELVASLRSEPAGYNRYVEQTAASDLLATLTHASLVRVNRASDELEPALAESWTRSDDGLSYTLKLRNGVRFSDGVPLTSADVVFSFRALYNENVHSVLAPPTMVGGKPLDVRALDDSTVVVRFPEPFAPGLRVLDNVPVLPRHKLETALNDGRFGDAWKSGTAPAEYVGLGPFVLSEHVAGQRMVFARNPHYWRKDDRGRQLPYLDKLTIAIIPDQNTEALRMESGDLDLMTNADIRPEDIAAFRRVAEQGRLKLLDGGVTIDPNLLWFNLSPARSDPRIKWLRSRELRHAISCAVDRRAIANTVFLGEAVPVYGPITPGNRTWYTPPASPCNGDPARAKSLLAAVGLQDRDGDGTLEDERGASARFSILTQSGHTIRVRTVAVIQEQLRRIGLTVDTVTADPGGLVARFHKRDYDAIYFGVQASTMDPALNPEFWLSSGAFHFWNPQQKAPATEWERQIDDLMRRHATVDDLRERKRLFREVLRIFEEELPGIYFVAPKMTFAVSSRVINPQPAPQIPQLLWSADTLAAAGR